VAGYFTLEDLRSQSVARFALFRLWDDLLREKAAKLMAQTREGACVKAPEVKALVDVLTERLNNAITALARVEEDGKLTAQAKVNCPTVNSTRFAWQCSQMPWWKPERLASWWLICRVLGLM
jgi:hypothetical protein